MFTRLFLSLLLSMTAAGCKRFVEAIDDPRAAATDEQVRQKWGKSLAELPTVELVAISAHNDDITDEFEWAFTLWHALEFGQKVDIDWLDVGGGGTTIGQFIRNSYENSKTGGIDIDILWGGGDILYVDLAAEGLLEQLQLVDDVMENVPPTLGGMALIDPGRLWVATALSGFGFIYNRQRLTQLGIDEPTTWEDLGSAEMFGQVCLADPTQSGSALAAYEMIVQSAPDWPGGWSRLMAVLSNASRIVESASKAADAPIEGTAAVATAIEFYGVNRVAEAPDVLAFALPAGEAIFTPDAIAILKNPLHPQLAQRFVDFVMSPRGQAMLALPPGSEDGPIRKMIQRLPVRRDVYVTYADKLDLWVPNPYQVRANVELDMAMRHVRYAVMPRLVKVAAIDNYDGMRRAKQKLIETNFPLQRLAEFNLLPDNVLTLEQIRQVGEIFRVDEKQANEILAGWREFFRQKYVRVVQ